MTYYMGQSREKLLIAQLLVIFSTLCTTTRSFHIPTRSPLVRIHSQMNCLQPPILLF